MKLAFSSSNAPGLLSLKSPIPQEALRTFNLA